MTILKKIGDEVALRVLGEGVRVGVDLTEVKGSCQVVMYQEIKDGAGAWRPIQVWRLSEDDVAEASHRLMTERKRQTYKLTLRSKEKGECNVKAILKVISDDQKEAKPKKRRSNAAKKVKNVARSMMGGAV